MGMDMDQVWSIFFINFFSAFEGVEISFFVFLFFFLWAGGEGIEFSSWTCSLFFPHIQMNVVVGMHSRKEREGKERRGREGLAGVERSRMDQGTG